jgi:competence protein ComEA
MKRHHIIPSLAALTLAFALPAMSWATNTASAAKSTTAKSGTTAKSTSATTTHAKSASSTSGKTSTTHHASNTSAKPHKIDLNSASREQLMTLPGVDGTMADKIISERPYKNMNELTAKKVVSKDEYNKIKNHVTAKQSTMHSEAPASQGNSGMASDAPNAGSSDQNPTDQTTK